MKIGPRPKGDPWTEEDERLLLALIASKTTKAMIARKLKRSIAAINKRMSILKKKAEAR